MTVAPAGAAAGPGLVVAVDIGTTGVKAAAVDVAAVSHGDAEREYPTTSPHPGWAVRDTGLTELAATAPPGAEGLLMLPYLAGERAPHWAGDPYGALLGLTQRHGRAHGARAALEGVCLQLALVLDAMRSAGLEPKVLRATGGFAHSPFWRQLLADVLGTPIGFPASAQGSAVGAALLGHVALGHLGSVDEAAALVRVTEVVHPEPDAAGFYRNLLPAFARTGEAVERQRAWQIEAPAQMAPEGSPRDR